MDYLGTKEIAQKWGISSRRVGVLLEQGKIEGAILVGKKWIIPADAEKPSDARRKKIDTQKESSDKDPFFFPFAPFNRPDRKYYDLTEEDRRERERLFELQNALLRSDYFSDLSEYLNQLSEMSEATSNINVKIGAIYTGLLIIHLKQDSARLKNILDELEAVFESDFPHKKDLIVLLEDARCYLCPNPYGQELDFSYNYCDEALSFKAVCSAYKSLLINFSKTDYANGDAYELILYNIKDRCSDFAVQGFHTYMAASYCIQGNILKGIKHLKAAFDLSLKTQIPFCPANVYLAIPAVFESVAKSYNDPYINKTVEMGKMISSILVQGTSDSFKTIFNNLEPEDRIYCVSIMRGMSNSEIAANLQVSEGTVSRKVNQILKRLNLNNRNDLKKLTKEILPFIED